jgi:hypothetical protein
MHKDTLFLETIGSFIKESGKVVSLVYSTLSKSEWKVSQNSRSIYNRTALVKLLIVMKFLDIPNVHRAIEFDLQKLLPFGKDVLYKVKNNVSINWRKLLLNQSYNSLKGITIEDNPKKSDEVPCFIIDDTDLPKTGKRIEFIGRIFSHIGREYKLGFKSLNLAYWTGKNLFHLDFSYHIEPGKKKKQGLSNKEIKQRYSKARETTTQSFQRINETQTKKTDNAIKMIRRAIKKGFKAQYILADSWFFSSALVTFSKDIGVHLITRPKFNNWKYEYEGKDYTLGKLVKKLRYTESKKWSRKLRRNCIKVKVKFKGVDMVLFLYKEKKRGVKWQAIITTDKSISAIKAFEIYQNRWAIETSFKELKQHLRYGKCQSQDFDAHISDATHTLMAFNYMSQVKTINEHESIGALFRDVSKNWLRPNIMQKFWNSFFNVFEKLALLFDKSIDDIIEMVTTKDNLILTLKNIFGDGTTET